MLKIKINNVLRMLKHQVGGWGRALKISFLRLNGIKIGTNCMISLGAKIDLRRGGICIGNNVTITYGCVILSHDGSARKINPSDDGHGNIRIEDNVFIGVNSVVLRNVVIGKNTIIGAGSVVSRSLPPNVVALGSPATVVKKLKQD